MAPEAKGTVYLRKDGRWSGQLRDPGQGRLTVYGHTRREAAHKLDALRRQLSDQEAEGTPAAPSLDTLRGRRSSIERLARQEGASNVRVFGSVARGEAIQDSDYDLVVDLNPQLRGLEAFDHLDRLEKRLSRLLGRPVHVITVSHPSEFTRRVLRDAVPL